VISKIILHKSFFERVNTLNKNINFTDFLIIGLSRCRNRKMNSTKTLCGNRIWMHIFKFSLFCESKSLSCAWHEILFQVSVHFVSGQLISMHLKCLNCNFWVIIGNYHNASRQREKIVSHFKMFMNKFTVLETVDIYSLSARTALCGIKKSKSKITYLKRLGAVEFFDSMLRNVPFLRRN